MRSTPMERRRFLQGALAAGTAAIAMPSVLADEVAAATGGNDTILLTLTLGGGNDGLNTVGPFTSGRYRDVRGPLSIPAQGSHVAGESLYFHPNLRRLATRFRRGDVAVIAGAGEPGLDRSHFSNLARWQSGRSDGGIGRTGWLGRWLDASGAGAFTGVAIGGQGVPLHLRGDASQVTDLPRHGGALYGSDTSERRDRVMFNRIDRLSRTTRAWPWVDAVADNNALAVSAAGSVAPAYPANLPEDRLHSDMVLAARLINLGLGTRVMNVWHGGYDTHDNQINSNSLEGDHAELLTALDIALDAFFNTLNATVAPRVVVLVYSEFGRRLEANGSRGTDHGTSSSIFAIGRAVRGGFYGDQPSLSAGQLDNRGDLQVTTDYRRVYATLLADWLGASPSQILGANYASLGFLSDPPAPAENDLTGRADQIRDREQNNRRNYLGRHSPSF